jgi:ferrous iron transport protein A
MSTRLTEPPCAYCGIPLVDMPCGCKLRVSDLSGTPSSRSRLYALGILPGTEMELCQPGDGAGNVCVRVRQSSLVLGESLAKSIFCRVIDENDLHKHGHSDFKHGHE